MRLLCPLRLSSGTSKVLTEIDKFSGTVVYGQLYPRGMHSTITRECAGPCRCCYRTHLAQMWCLSWLLFTKHECMTDMSIIIIIIIIKRRSGINPIPPTVIDRD